MTTPEHSLVGILGSLALGMDRRFGWPLVGFAAVASNLPDLDGLPMLLDMARFEAGHRVWCHNVLAIAISSVALSWTQARYRWVEWLGGRLSRWLPVSNSTGNENVSTPGFGILLLVAFSFQLAHLVCDMVVSGGQGLSDWKVTPWWPVSDQGWVFPLIPWGDVGPTVIMMGAVIVMARWPQRRTSVAWAGLLTLISYMFGRYYFWTG